MSIYVMADIWVRELKPTLKFILMAYGDHADHEGNNIFPAVLTVSRKTGFSKRTVQNATRELESMGILVADGQGNQQTNKWSYTFGGASPARGGASPARGGVHLTTQGGASPAPEPLINHQDETSFNQTWEEWEHYRKESRKTITPTTKKKQLLMLEKYPLHTAISMIEQSMTNGWQGIFELKNGKKPTPSHTSKPSWNYPSEDEIAEKRKKFKAHREKLNG